MLRAGRSGMSSGYSTRDPVWPPGPHLSLPMPTWSMPMTLTRWTTWSTKWVEGGGGRFVLHEPRNDGHAEEAVLIGDGPGKLVTLGAVVVGNRLRVGVADDHGCCGQLDCVPPDGLAAVAHVDDHVQLVEALDDGAPEVGDAAGVVLRAAVTHEVAKVVRELDLAEAEVVEEVDPFDVGAERDGVLEVDDDAVLALAVDSARCRRR